MALKGKATQEGPNFLDLAFYVGGKILPKGKWAMEFNLMLHAGTRADGTSGVARLGAMATCYPIDDEGNLKGEPQDHFFSFGSKAHESWAPHPETGKSLVPVPGGSGAGATNKSNWVYFLKSLYDCGLPAGSVANDFSALDGIWIHTDNIPEPEERKGFKAATGEASSDGQAYNNQMVVAVEILDGGKPWEGTGGIPEAKAAGKGKPAVAGKVAGKIAPKGKAAPEPEPEEEAGGDEDVKSAAEDAFSDILSKKEFEKGLKKIKLRTETFKIVKAKHDDDMAQKVVDEILSDDSALATVLEALGYTVKGTDIVPA